MIVINIDVQKLAHKIFDEYPDLQWEQKSGDYGIRLTHHNKNNPRFPLIVSIDREEGIFLDFSRNGGILECIKDVSEVKEFIEEILNDRVAVAVAYPDEESFQSQTRPMIERIFYFGKDGQDEDDVDDVAYERFIRRISKPRLLGRLNIFAFHGIIEVSDWSGKRYSKTYRK